MQTVFDFTVPGSAVSYRRSTGAGFVDAAALQDAPRLHTPQMAANWQPMWWYGGWCAGFAAGPRGVAASPAPCRARGPIRFRCGCAAGADRSGSLRDAAA